MLPGAIDTHIRRWLAHNAGHIAGRALFVACSGKFTPEQILAPKSGAVYSNDTSTHAYFIGSYLAGVKPACRIKDPAWSWLSGYLDVNPAATVVNLIDLAAVARQRNVMERRLYAELRASWDRRFAKSCERMEQIKAETPIRAFSTLAIGEFIDFARATDPGGVLFVQWPCEINRYASDPRVLDAILEWPAPAAEKVTQERKGELREQLLRSGLDYICCDDQRIDSMPCVLLKNRTYFKGIHVYSNLPGLDRVYVKRHQQFRECLYPLLTDADCDRITMESRLQIVPALEPEINYYKVRFMKKTIDFTDGFWNFMVFVDGRLFGFIVASPPRTSRTGAAGEVYVLSDFVVPVSKNKRVAKLLLLSMQTKRFKALLGEATQRPIGHLLTSAFTTAPVSMKYRGVFNLVNRGVTVDAVYGTEKPFLNYGTDTGLYDEREALAVWIKKFRR
jgi:hypothetical protein